MAHYRLGEKIVVKIKLKKRLCGRCELMARLNANHDDTKYSAIRLSGQLPIVFYNPNAQPILQGHL